MGDGLKQKFWLNVTMAVILLATAVTGIINLLIVILSADNWKSFLWLDPDLWPLVHAFFGVTTVVLILVHIVIHKDWISFSYKKIFSKTNAE